MNPPPPALARGWFAGAASLPGLVLAPALVLALAGASCGRPGSAREDRDLSGERLAAPYERLGSDLDARARKAQQRLRVPVVGRQDLLAAFRTFAELSEPGRGSRITLLLIDGAGEAVAWGGEGMLHELDPHRLPAEGFAFQAGFGAVTLMAVRPLEEGPRPWRVVVARSSSTDRLPDDLDPGLGASPLRRWSLVDDPSEAAEGAILFERAGLPALVLAPRRETRPAYAFRPEVLAALALGFLLAVAGLLRLWRRPPGPGPGAWVLAAGAAATAMLLFLCFFFQTRVEPVDLSSGIGGSPEVLLLRVALLAATVGLLSFAYRRLPRPAAAASNERWSWIALLLTLLGAASHDRVLMASLILVAAGAAISLALSLGDLGRWASRAVFLILAAILALGVWETAYRFTLERQLSGEILPRMRPPTEEDRSVLVADLEAFFADWDLAAYLPRSPKGLEIDDLAFTLWKESPLIRSNALSALVVERLDGLTSTFSAGLPLDEDSRLDRSPDRWQGLRLPGWEQALVEGEAELRHLGRPWARARYWILLRPGFLLSGGTRGPGVEKELLAGRLGVGQRVEGLPPPALYGLYSVDGRSLQSPWPESAPLPPELAQEPEANFDPRPRAVETATPVGPARAYAARSEAGWEVIFLPRLSPAAALERVATGAGSVLLLVLLLVLAGVLIAMPRSAFGRLLDRAVHSYSRRLILVYTLLLLIPLLVLVLLVLATAEDRMRGEQRSAGEAALRSAQSYLGDYVLKLEPGFSIDATLNDELLVWLRSVVEHDVNLYWGSQVYASSKSELFAAGLLPRRIPGEIYSRIALRSYDLAARTARVREADYLELYAPLRVPGVATGEEVIFLSMPLLAQQEEVEGELAALRRRAFLFAAFLFALMVAVGFRLARNFTEPLMELVEGTKRIAAGATSLELSPSELELAALVGAIDDMAGRIADGRQRLLREKQVVERMVDNITSAVVSLDRDRRVLMRNRVAAELLGVEVGERLDESLSGDSRLAPVAAFLDEISPGPRQKALPLEGEDGEEREWSLVWVPVPGDGEPAALLVVEDVTEVLRGERLGAWAEMARTIAHEIKNPLTPIRLNAEHVRQVYVSDPEHFGDVFERCIDNILDQVGELQQIASEFSDYSSILASDLKADDLVTAISHFVEPYRSAPPEGVRLRFEPEESSIPVRVDRRLLGRAVRNLVENALRASEGGGEVVLRVDRHNGSGRVTVLDTGPGVEASDLGRIFDPYFSTHATGTGLGLPISRRIAEEHGGTITARNREEGGLAVTLTIPLDP